MKQQTIIFLCFFALIMPLSGYASGFAAGTLVRTIHGYVPIEMLDVGDIVLTYDQSDQIVERPITHVRKSLVDRYVRLQVGADTLCVDPCQQLYLVHDKGWVLSAHLSAEDHLACSRTNHASVDRVEWVDEPITLYSLSIQEHHTFLVTRYDFCAHNFFPLLAVGFGLFFGAGSIEFGGITVGLLACGLMLSGVFKKNNGDDYSFHIQNGESVSISAGGFPPEDPDKKKRDRDAAREDYRPLTNKEARDLAKKMGFKESKNPPFNPHNKAAFRKGNIWITPDRNGHKGGVWKVFEHANRQGTFSKDLSERIGA